MRFSCGARSAFKRHGTRLLEKHAIASSAATLSCLPRLERRFEIPAMTAVTTKHPDYMIRAGAVRTKHGYEHPLEVRTEFDCETTARKNVRIITIGIKTTTDRNPQSVERKMDRGNFCSRNGLSPISQMPVDGSLRVGSVTNFVFCRIKSARSKHNSRNMSTTAFGKCVGPRSGCLRGSD